MKEFLNVESIDEMPTIWSDDLHVSVLTNQESFTSYTGTSAADEGETRYRFSYVMYTKDEWQDYITREISKSAVAQLDQSLEAVKARRVKESRECLEQYYETHPLFSTVHSDDGKYYSVTTEKQNRLMNMIELCEYSVETGKEFTPVWNATGEVNEPWTKHELQMLAIQIAEYIQPMVVAQQKFESDVQLLESTDDVDELWAIYSKSMSDN